MHDQPIPGRREAGSAHKTQARDLHDQRTALIQVLAIHRAHLRLPEIVRELTDDPDDFSQRDAVERAVVDLVGAGLLFHCEGLLLPTRAALRFDEILGEQI